VIDRRTFSVSLLVCAAAPLAGARADVYPSGQIRLIVPFPPGGATDVLGRIVGQSLQTLWNQTIIQENKPGAAGLIGARQVSTGPADGYTLLLASTGTILAIASDVKATRDFDISNEVAPVSLIAAPPYILVVNPSLPVKSTAELIAYAKANKGKLSYGSSGVGSASHLSGALFASMANVDMLHIPYRGTGPAVTDLLGGRIQVMFAPAPSAMQHVVAGTLRTIGTTGAARSALFPDIPTVAETGLPGYESVGWFGIFAPAKTPRDIVEKISADMQMVLKRPDAVKRLEEQGAEPAANSPQAFTDYINADVRKWLALAEKTGIKLGN
jgi:tripartite-type tricarboxylate transporter receptor subunit TctC